MNVDIRRRAGVFGALARAARRHWLFTSVFVIGVALRAAVQIAYWPALLYIDSVRYLYAESNWDPLGYLIVAWPLLKLGGLALVSVVQHLLGLAMAAGIYRVALRRGAARWLAALAAAPVLLDAYQLQVEQNIMADTLFEAVVVACLALLLWDSRPPLRAAAAAGLGLGTAGIIRVIGLFLVLPAALYVWHAARGIRWRPVAHAALLCAGFAVPVVGYLMVTLAATGQMKLAGQGSNLYGRAAAAADCQTLQIPGYEAPLCPSRSVVRTLGVDGLVHDRRSPLYTARPPHGMSSRRLRGDFTRQVLLQQPIAVATAVAKDVADSFGYPRRAGQADTPLFRWQFQTSYPQFPARLTHAREASIMRQFGGGKPTVVRPLAAALRIYQLDGGYTPGPVLALAGIVGIAGAAGADRLWRRRQRPELRAACLLVIATSLVVLAGADIFEFSWRYQLPGLVTLPLAGALGLAALSTGRTHADGEAPPAAGPPGAAVPADAQATVLIDGT